MRERCYLSPQIPEFTFAALESTAVWLSVSALEISRQSRSLADEMRVYEELLSNWSRTPR